MSETVMIAGGIALVAALAMPDLRRLRIGALAAALLVLAGAMAQGAWGFALLAGLVALVTAAPIVIAATPGGKIRFTAAEAQFRAQHLGGIGAGLTRGLLDQGHWIDARAGETLIREGQAVAGLFYLAQGQAVASRGRQPVGQIGPGELIGEAGVLDDVPATATVTLECDSRIWFVLAPALGDYVAVHDEVGQALRRSFGMALRGKLEESNRSLAARVG